MAAVKETETSEELFISLVGLIFFLGLRSACIASAYGLGYTTDLPMASEKKSNLGKKSSSMVSFFYRPKNSLETEYIFLLAYLIRKTTFIVDGVNFIHF